MYFPWLNAIQDFFYLEAKLFPTRFLPIQSLFYLLLFPYLLIVYCILHSRVLLTIQSFTYNLEFYLQSRVLLTIQSFTYNLEFYLQIQTLFCIFSGSLLFEICFILNLDQSFNYNLDIFLYLQWLIAIRDLFYFESTF